MWLIYLGIVTGIILFTTIFVRKGIIGSVWLVWVNILLTSAYLVWRVTVIPFNSLPALLLGILLLWAEMIGIVQMVINQLLLHGRYRIARKTLKHYGADVPSVDLFICTYNEPVELVETTVLAALGLKYPKGLVQVYLCDDGHRDGMRRLAERSKVKYLSREGNEGAKAGNINYALGHSCGELFVVLDADMICTSEFLEKTVGYFTDTKVAFVQTPQVYYNKDMYQHNLNPDIPNEQDFFMREIQEARAKWNAVLHVGTNAVFRRKYVEEIGLYPTDTITEDMAVGLLLQAAGYQSMFINEVLVLGLTASTYTDLVVQRDRWCRGNMQTTKSIRPLRQKNLDFRQKIAYYSGMLYWYTGFSKMIFWFCPIWFLFTGQRAMAAGVLELSIFFLPYFTCQAAVFIAMVSNARSLKWAHYYDIAMAPHMCRSVLRELFSSRVHFSVTPKELRDDKSFFQFQVIIPHLIMGILAVLALLAGSIFYWQGSLNLFPFVINSTWNLYNLWGIVVCIRVAYHIGETKKSDEYDVSGGYGVNILQDKKMFTGEILSLTKQGLILCAGKALDCKIAQIHFVYRGEDYKIDGEVSNYGEENRCIYRFIYKEAGIGERKALVGIYTDHLQPSFQVEKRAEYI